jgi:Raf kinase inhibitor-like YbhB/YbcL family protein
VQTEHNGPAAWNPQAACEKYHPDVWPGFQPALLAPENRVGMQRSIANQVDCHQCIYCFTGLLFLVRNQPETLKENIMGFALSTMELASSAFEQGGRIPVEHTGEGVDVSPALSWSGAPDGTQSYAIICHDPDAPLVTPAGTYGFVHWVLYNVPSSTTGLAESAAEFTQGKNDFGKTGYNGPMPPNGHGTHQYYFWVLALDADLQLEAGLTLWQLLQKVEANLIGMNRLVGTYSRD